MFVILCDKLDVNNSKLLTEPRSLDIIKFCPTILFFRRRIMCVWGDFHKGDSAKRLSHGGKSRKPWAMSRAFFFFFSLTYVSVHSQPAGRMWRQEPLISWSCKKKKRGIRRICKGPCFVRRRKGTTGLGFPDEFLVLGFFFGIFLPSLPYGYIKWLRINVPISSDSMSAFFFFFSRTHFTGFFLMWPGDGACSLTELTSFSFFFFFSRSSVRSELSGPNGQRGLFVPELKKSLRLFWLRMGVRGDEGILVRYGLGKKKKLFRLLVH